MRGLLSLALLSGLALSAVAAERAPSVPPSKPMKLFLLIGQSNMAGRGLVGPAEKMPHPRVFALNKEMTWVPAVDPLHWDKPDIAGVGPGSSFARTIADADKDAVIGLIPAAFGGTSLDQWAIGGELYTNAVKRAKEAMRRGQLAGILWHQGEADSAPEKVATYAARFQKMIAQLRADLDAPKVPVIVGELGRFRANDASVAINAVLDQLPEHVALCACVSSAGLADKGDKLHFDTPSQQEFGRRYAQAWLALAKR